MSLQLLQRYLSSVQKIGGSAPEIQHGESVAVYLNREEGQVLPPVVSDGRTMKTREGKFIVDSLKSLGFDVQDHTKEGSKTMVLGFRDGRASMNIAAVHYWRESKASDKVLFTVSMDMFKDYEDLAGLGASPSDEQVFNEAKADVTGLIADADAIKALLVKR